jgi:hypothetical protein
MTVRDVEGEHARWKSTRDAARDRLEFAAFRASARRHGQRAGRPRTLSSRKGEGASRVAFASRGAEALGRGRGLA